MGAGTTTMAAFLGGRLVHLDGFALGGHHVTMDIARGLNARVADAERIKTLYGSVLSGGSDERDMITVPPLSEDEREQAQFVSRATLVEHHQAARRGNTGNGARPARRDRRSRPSGAVMSSSPAARASSPDCRIWRRAFSAGRCASDGRSALPERRTRPKARPSPWRPDSWFIRKRRISNISSRGASGNS